VAIIGDPLRHPFRTVRADRDQASATALSRFSLNRTATRVPARSIARDRETVRLLPLGRSPPRPPAARFGPAGACARSPQSWGALGFPLPPGRRRKEQAARPQHCCPIPQPPRVAPPPPSHQPYDLGGRLQEGKARAGPLIELSPATPAPKAAVAQGRSFSSFSWLPHRVDPPSSSPPRRNRL